MKSYRFFLLVVGALSLANAKSNPVARPLDIFFLNMDGGASTLIVTPFGESILIDTGSLRPKLRDAERINRATQAAGLKQIDHLITTHFHTDHFGSISDLAEMIPIKSFYDKGVLPPEKDSDWFRELYPLYRQVTNGKLKTLKAGDDLPLKNDPGKKLPALRLHCLAAEKKVEGFTGDIDAPVDGYEIRSPDESDNARSIALLLTYGKFTFFAGGDITWNVEHHLVHPKNLIGQVDLYQVTHHGLDQSNNPLLLQAITPTVCVAMNGPQKGIEPNTFKNLRQLPSLRAIYQIHFNTQFGEAGNAAAEFIANPQGSQKAEWIKASVHPEEGIFSISIGEGGDERVFPIL